MGSYQHLSFAQRVKINTLRLQHLSSRDIALSIGRHHSTVSRELRRNHQGHSQMSGYVPELAQSVSAARKATASQRLRLGSEAIREHVKEMLSIGWSPEQIAGSLPQYFENQAISHEAIYQFIYKDFSEGIPLLARRHRQRYPRGKKRRGNPPIKNRVDIDLRPAGINERSEFGHWESDSMACSSGRFAINVVIERVSRRVFIRKLQNKKAHTTQQAIVRSLLHVPPHARKSITYDNGSENYYHESVNHKLGMQSFFCKPYHSWEKGSVENANGLIRRYIPKKTNLDNVTQEELTRIEKLINNRPRKCLGFKTAAECFASLCLTAT